MPLDDADDVGGFGQPLPPDDRLWRHPSELFAIEGPQPHGVDGVTSRPRRRAAERAWLTATVAAVAGAAAATAVLLATGPWHDATPRDVIERVALSPMVSAPTVRGDRKVIEVAELVGPSVGRVEIGDGARTGSAVAFRDDGHLLTSASLVGGASSIDLVVGGERLAATLVGQDDVTGVAVLRTAPGVLPAAVLGDPASLQVGEPAVAVWATWSGASEPMVATGVVSGTGQRVERAGGGSLYGLLQLDVALTPDAVGGPVLDSRGAVIGIADAAGDDGGRFGFAIPIDVARHAGADLIRTGTVRHCWLGIAGVDLDRAETEQLGIAGGARVHRVFRGGPAGEAGVQRGDVIVQLDDRPIRSMDDLVGALRSYRPGDVAVVRHLRDGTPIESRLVLTERG